MSLYKIYDASNVDMAKTNSYLGIGNGFCVSLFHNDFHKYNSDYWRIPIENFTGIMLENLSLNFQTNWGDAGGAILGKKIDSFVNSKFVKMLAGQSDAGFQPFICSDAWTQQKMAGDAQPVQVQLKFRAYNLDRMGCTNYNDVILFLTHICSPVKSSSSSNNPAGRGGLGDDIASTLNNDVDGASNIVGTIVESGKTFVAGFSNQVGEGETADQVAGRKNKFAAAAKSLVETADSTYNKIVSKTAAGKNNGNFTVDFSLGDKINKKNLYVNSKNENAERVTSEINIDWIVKSFSFTPSRQFQMVKEQGISVPKPLWINFDLSLETRLSLSNRYIYNVLIPQSININETVLSP